MVGDKQDRDLSLEVEACPEEKTQSLQNPKSLQGQRKSCRLNPHAALYEEMRRLEGAKSRLTEVKKVLLEAYQDLNSSS